MRKIVLLGLLAVAGCSRHTEQAKPAESVPARVASAETYKSPQGIPYAVSHATRPDHSELPSNADLKMANGDLAKYAETLCTLDVPPKFAPQRCDIYVQADPHGTLIGYAAVKQDAQGVSFNTATTLNEAKQPGGVSCNLSGKLEGSEASAAKTIADASKDFDGQFMYSAWEKDPGNYLISPAESDNSNDDAHALGVWYVAKKGDKLRISQERWNYCYADKNVIVDDVFYRLISLAKIGANAPEVR